MARLSCSLEGSDIFLYIYFWYQKKSVACFSYTQNPELTSKDAGPDLSTHANHWLDLWFFN